MNRVYVIQCEQFFKIGYTGSTVKKRVAGIKTSNPFAITIILDMEFTSKTAAGLYESYLHTIYSEKRVSGEWFALSAADVYNIQKHVQEQAKNLHCCKLVNKPIALKYNPKYCYWRNKYLQQKEQTRKEAERVAVYKNRYENVHRLSDQIYGFKEEKIQELEIEVERLEAERYKLHNKIAAQTIDNIIDLLKFKQIDYNN